jgi:hypothetical protein
VADRHLYAVLSVSLPVVALFAGLYVMRRVLAPAL